MAEAWKRQIRHTQFRNHSNKWGRAKAVTGIGGAGEEMTYAPGPARRADKAKRLVEEAMKRTVPSNQGRESR